MMKKNVPSSRTLFLNIGQQYRFYIYVFLYVCVRVPQLLTP